MGIDPKAQLVTALLIIASGGLYGILYDALRAVRRSCTCFVLTFLCDILFLLTVLAGMFLTGYLSGGVLRLYYFAFAALGIGLYFRFLSPFVYKFFAFCLSLVLKFLGFILFPVIFSAKQIKKFIIFLQNIFYLKKKCYTMKMGVNRLSSFNVNIDRRPVKGHENETEKSRYHY